MPNHLIHEKSPYLQQHAHNPVEWYPWGEEAFERARREEKPIFLSIGYSTCHWCHVMERESFENEATAAVMNELFVNIKVDREERPDVDHVYMTAVQALTGAGGWPLSAWLLPDLRPFYAGTYFPPRPAYGRSAFVDVLRALSDAWKNQRDKVENNAVAITNAIEKGSIVSPTPRDLSDNEVVQLCYGQLEQSYDGRYGGFSTAPKFPRPSIFEFLLRYFKIDNSPRALEMVMHTMEKMASGGMYDQLGGGFARYSVDAEWRVPHFEKMLYDQGQLVATYADAYRVSRDKSLADTIRHTIEYLERDMTSPSGAFYSAEDADSEGEEGTFYVWTYAELESALTPEEFAVVELYYGITESGNFEHGKNVLHTSSTAEHVASTLRVHADDVAARLTSARAKLFELRSHRVRPHRDEKILTSWNGLMISGLARAASALDEPRYAEIARRAADAILGRMYVDGRLMHRMREEEVKFDGYLEDYAFLTAGLLDLYEATFDVAYLRRADELTREADRLFHDDEHGGYFMTAGDDRSVLVRSKSDHDGAEPAGNSVMAMNLLRIGNAFHDEELLGKARRTIELFVSRIERYPMMMPLMVAASLAASHPPRQLVIAASSDEKHTQHLVRQVRAAYLPDTAILFIPSTGIDRWLAERNDMLEVMTPLGEKAAIYMCENMACQRPVTEFEVVSGV